MEAETRVHVQAPQLGLNTATTAMSHMPLGGSAPGTHSPRAFARPAAGRAWGVGSTRNSRATGGGRRRKPPPQGRRRGEEGRPREQGEQGQGPGGRVDRGREGGAGDGGPGSPLRGRPARGWGRESLAAGGQGQIPGSGGKRSGRGPRGGCAGGGEGSRCSLAGAGPGPLLRVAGSRAPET